MTWLDGRKSIGTIKCGQMTKLLRRYDWFNKDIIGYFKMLWLCSTNAIAAVYPALRKRIECFRILKITVFSEIYYARTIHTKITSIRQQRYFQDISKIFLLSRHDSYSNALRLSKLSNYKYPKIQKDLIMWKTFWWKVVYVNCYVQISMFISHDSISKICSIRGRKNRIERK